MKVRQVQRNMDAFQDCLKDPSSKLPEVIDKKQLAQAVKRQNKQQLTDFALGKQIPSKEILSAIKIETLGDIQIPVSLEVTQLHYCTPYLEP